MSLNTANSWSEILEQEFKKPYFQALSKRLAQETKEYKILPEKENIFNAFKLCPLDKVKICILAQDPYPHRDNAIGICFSVNPGVSVPASLKNIYKELQSDLGVNPPNHGDLRAWCKQGVMLLNTILTVREGQSASHRNIGWEQFSDHIISVLNQQEKPIVWMLWGSYAKSKIKLLNNKKHLILQSGHPSPLNVAANPGSWFGNKHFSKANEFLEKQGIAPINWHIPDGL